MLFNEKELDEVVFEILSDCREVDPPLDRNEISRHVADHLSEQIHKFVFASLARLVEQGRVIDDRTDTRSAPFRFWLPPVAAQG